MNIPSKHLEDLVEHFSSLPGIGKKTALRLVLNLLKREESEIEAFSKSLGEMHQKISSCTCCGNISDGDLCSICTQNSRKKELICVVEDIRDIMAIESTEQFYGVYHVLGGVISPMEGIGPHDLNIDSLVERVKSGEVNEVVLALNASMEGDTTNFYIFKKIQDYNIQTSTIARGISVGDELEYADEITLGRSIVNRIPFENTLKL